MKKNLFRIIFFCTALSYAAVQPDLEIFPSKVIAGEPAELVIAVEANKPPAFVRTPEIEGLVWLGSASSVQSRYINGKYSGKAERRYSFIIEKPGTYTIPQAEITVSGKKIRTKEISFTVEKASLRTDSSSGIKQNEIELDEAIFSKLLIPGKKETYYTGEYIPLEIMVYCLAGVKMQLAYPSVAAENDNIVYRDYKDINSQNPHFDRPSSFAERIDGKEYICYRFKTEIRAISAGKLDLSVRVPTEIQVPGSPSSRSAVDPFFDDFFSSGFFSKTIRHTVSAKTGEITIRPLPPVPENTNWLGLAGTWKIIPSLSEKETSVGEAITLRLKISGSGGLENLHAPEIKNKGFRIYSPEIIRNPDGRTAEIRYIMIPTKSGLQEISQNFSTFDSAAGKYVLTKFEFPVKVEEAATLLPAAAGPNVVDTARPEPAVQDQPEHDLAGIMYLKKIPENSINNRILNILITCFFVLLGFAILIGCEMAYFLIHGASPAAKRKNLARKQKKTLLTRIKESDSDGIYKLSPEIADYLNAALDLPRGSSLDEIASAVKKENPALAKELTGISAGAWAPGAAFFSEERKNNLLKLLSKVVCIALFFTGFSLSAAPLTQEHAAKSYDSGDFNGARNFYISKLNQSSESPELLYNIGNCYYQEKKFRKALICYEKAHLLAPRDKEIIRNLELTRRELNLSEKNSIEKPGDIPSYLRDKMTPEEWMLLAAVGIFLILGGYGFRRFFSPRFYSGPATLIGGILLILGISMMISQLCNTYSSRRAMIIQDHTVLRTLPSETSPVVSEEKLHTGEEVSIRENRNNWIRIKAGNAVGWIPATAIETFSGKPVNVF